MKSLVTLLLLGTVCAALAESDLMEMSFDKFDQNDASGWRPLSAAGRDREAADLIDRYLRESPHAAEGASLLNFHAGQCYAFAGMDSFAIERFERSFQTGYPDSFRAFAEQWNAYVRANIAFLKKDVETLKKCRDEIAAGPEGPMRDDNGKIVASMIESVGLTYKEMCKRGEKAGEPGATDNPDDAQ